LSSFHSCLERRDDGGQTIRLTIVRKHCLILKEKGLP
jgi:hypothetical protein